RNFLRVFDLAGLDHLRVELGKEVLLDVKNIGDTARHTSSEVAASASEDDNATTRHVLATVVANALNDRRGSRVTDRESFRSDATEEASARSGTVQADVADQDVLLRLENGGPRWVDDQATTGQALADVVVRVALQLKRDTGGQEGAER